MANQTRIIKIDGMTCAKCVESVHSTTGDIDGLISLTVELPTNQATVTFDDSITSAEKLLLALKRLDLKLLSLTLELKNFIIKPAIVAGFLMAKY